MAMSVKRAIIAATLALAVLASLLQVVIDSSPENAVSVCLVLASSISMLLYISYSDAMSSQPLSTFVIFGFCVTSQLGALLVQTVAWTALKSSLYDPVYTFGTLAFYQAIAMGVHASYRFFSASKPNKIQFFRGVLEWAGLYRTPRCNELWLIGCVGLASYVVYVKESILLSPLGKFGMAFNFLAWAPFLIPFFVREAGETYCHWRLNRLVLIGYAVILVGLGLALNTRGVMFFGVATIGLLYLLTAMRSDSVVTPRSIVRITALAAMIFVVAGPVSDLVTAMAIARGLGKVPVTVKIEKTYRVWRRPDLIAAYRAYQARALIHKAYDDHYIENPILARFVLTKYYDNALHFASRISTDDARSSLQDVSVKYFWAVLPAPVLGFLGVNVTKTDLDYSMGDYLPYLTGGGPLGGHRVGSMLGQGIVLFGPLFPFVFAAICLGLFGLMDLLTMRHVSGMAAISVLGMLQIFSYFISGLVYEGLHVVFYFFVRNFEQTVLVYVVVFAFARRILRSEQSPRRVSNTRSWGSSMKSSSASR
jgi:hypothetical protein